MDEKLSLIKCGNFIFLGLVCFPFLLFTSNLATAGLVTFQKEYTYRASDADSKISSRTTALGQVKRLLLEELGTYLESETEIKNFQLTKDQIVVLTGGIVRARIIDEKWDGKTYYLKAKITTDPKELEKSIDILRKDRQKVKELQETKEKADELRKEVERLKKELEMAKTDKVEQKQKDYLEAIKGLSANDLFENGYSMLISGRYEEAIDPLSMAIELNPGLIKAYYYRGITYVKLGDDQKAMKDFDKAIELDPKFAKAYYCRGLLYGPLGVKDFDKAIDLNPKFENAYASRGYAYLHLKDYQKAIKDFDMAIRIGGGGSSSEAHHYHYYRGLTYSELGDIQQAIKDYDMAIWLRPGFGLAYSARSLAYSNLGDWQKSMRDTEKVMEIINIQMFASKTPKHLDPLSEEPGPPGWGIRRNR
jgi:tetratricopeptide (TPR) repeat protein